jgi:uncharacterized ferritin-like protein (DUF455 family)
VTTLAEVTLTEGAVDILLTAAPEEKVAATYALADVWHKGVAVGNTAAPDRPARPPHPELRRPGDMPKRSMGPKGRIAFVHALAHIELNAVDLAWDIVARFAGQGLPRSFYNDWVGVAVEEAEHFTALADRLVDWGAAYGDLPAHDSLWDAAMVTADDLSARLAIIPMTLEARGIDTTPGAIERCRAAGDPETAAILQQIYDDEIKHLAVGVQWFEYCCSLAKTAPQARYAALLTERFRGDLKPPFNLPARAQAGMDESYLKPWLS